MNANGNKYLKKRLMQRFSHSVNSDDKDDNIEYVPVGDQKVNLEFLELKKVIN
jgi:hypothetical protein